MNKFTDFYTAWNFLMMHKMFKGRFQECLDIEVVKVSPITNCIEDDNTLNTKTAVWLECGEYDDRYPVHDLDLDCGGDTFEIAIIELANLVDKHYDENGAWRV